MADISPQLNEILKATFGEEVRGSIVSALQAMNAQAEAAAAVANSVDSRFTALETDNTKNKSDIQSALSSIQGLQQADADIIARLVTDETFRETYEPKIIQALQDIETHKGQITAVTEQASTNKANLAYLVDQITAVNAGPRLTNLEKRAANTDNQILSLQNASDAATSNLNAFENELASTANLLDALRTDQQSMSLVIEGKIDGAFVENGYLILTSNGEAVSDPIGPFAGGGGGGGSTGNGATLSVTNTNGWLSKTIAYGDSCVINLNWSSIEDENPTGDGTLRVVVNGAIKTVVNVEQGPIQYDIGNFLAAGSNIVKLTVSDVYGNSRTFNFSITVVKISISSPFDSSAPFTGSISFPYVPEGQATKTVHFILDGSELDTVETPVSGRQLTYTIPAQTHGTHSLRVYFTADINGQEVTSNELYFEFMCLQPNNLAPIITCGFNQEQVSQYTTLQITYQVYDPSSLTSQVALKANGATVKTVTVDRSQQTWAYKADKTGALTLSIESVGVSKTINITVTAVNVEIEAETEGLQLYLSSYGRSNGEANPFQWSSGSVNATFTNFNGVSDCWQLDDDGIAVCRVTGDARLYIPFNIFSEDFRTTGRTIEFDFATRDVRDYDAEIISCWSGNRGIKITAQEAVLKSAQSEIKKQYKDEEHIRVSFVIEKRAETRLIYIFIDGVIEGVVRYPDTDDFSQTGPVGISIGSSDCTVDLYTVRVYDHNLTKVQVLNNWIMDTQDGQLMLERYSRNNVYDVYGQIVIDKLPNDLGYMIMDAPVLPQYKGDKKTIQGSYTDPTNASKSFTYQDASADVQGTSSQYYARKNYKIKYAGGFIFITGQSSTYAINVDAIPTKTFTFKADVASSEGCNNVELVRLFNEICPYKTPPQLENAKVRQGIDGFPIVIFWDNGDSTTFLGKYNFNNDKGTPEVFGFGDGDESWETLNNTSNRCLFKTWDDGVSWEDDFEGRYPDGSTSIQNLKAFVNTVAAWNNPTKSQIESVAEKESALFYYIFTELFLMVDSRCKNAFPTRFAGAKWCWLPYDFDTAIGINNEGQYVFNYNLETGDKIGDDNVFNGEGHAFWDAIRYAYPDEIASMYESLRNSGALSYTAVRKMFDDHQSKWPEAIFNEDAQYKYLDPLVVSNDASYLTMLQGTKRSVRNWWLYHRFLYLDSKYNVAENRNQVITVRGYAKANLSVTPFADMYCNIKYGSALVQARGVRNTAYTLTCPLDQVNDTETYIYGANMIKKVDNLPAYQVGYANFSMGTKLQEIVLGSTASGYQNQRLTELHLGDLKLLKKIDCRNCVNLGTGTMATIDASGCANIEEIYMDNTKITGLDLPNGGQLRVLHLPSTITNLTLRNQSKLTDLTVPSFANVSTLVLENVSSVIDPLSLLDQIAANARLRLIGLDLGDITSAQLRDFMDVLDNFRGLDDAGNTVATAQVSGTCHIANVTGEDMAEFQSRYPYITVTYDHLTAYVYYYNETGSSLLYTETVQDGGNATWTGTSSKSSTAQYTYTFDGWSSTPGGSKWSAAQTAVNADRNLYAHFTASLRYYTVYFYNGSTLLQTVTNVPYGGSATYSGNTSDLVDPNGTGVAFQEWSPSPKNITGNTSCYASYLEPVEVAEISDSWETIIANVNNGTYRSLYKVGNYKPIDMGSEGVVNMQIVAFDKDVKADDSKAPISWLSKELLATSSRWNTQIEYIYDFIDGPSWAASGSKWTSKISYSISQAQATWILTATADGTLRIGYKTSGSSDYGKLTLTVNGTSVVTDYVNTTEKIYSVDVSTGDTVTVSATFNLTSEVSGSATIAYYGSYSIESSTISNAPIRTQVGYVDGTGTCGTYEKAELRQYYLNTLYPLIPETVRNAIAPVKKTVDGYGTDMQKMTSTVTDPVWLPSQNEVTNSISNGGIYARLLSDDPSRKKYKVGNDSASEWWLLTSDSNYTAYIISSSGGSYTASVISSKALALGFCF